MRTLLGSLANTYYFLSARYILKTFADPAQLTALTSLTIAEFNHLLYPFEDAFLPRLKMYKIDAKRRLQAQLRTTTRQPLQQAAYQARPTALYSYGS